MNDTVLSLDVSADNRWIDDNASQSILEPATGQLIHGLVTASPTDVAAIAQKARADQPQWFATPYEERAQVLRKAADLMECHQQLYVSWLVREAGSIIPKAQFEVALSIKALREAAAMPSQPQGLVLPTDPQRLSFCRRMPLGVVGVIAPFNFPLYLSLRAIAPALAVGNAVVLKPDPRTTISGGLLIERLFNEAGLPEAMFQVVPGKADIGEALCTDANVAMIQFTGSTAAGRKIGALAGGQLKKHSLELGGKNALIILDDADLDIAVSNIAWSAFLHQGQICMAGGRILVQDTIYAELAEKLATKAKQLPVGDPASGQVALGPLINSQQVTRVENIVNNSVAEGAQIKVGGVADGAYFSPTVVTGVTPAMAIFHEEIFGPVAVLIPFKSDAEAISLANDTAYGLSAGVISNSVGRAMALGNKLRTGIVHINDQTVADEVVNPFGGSGQSGNGSSIGGPANWDEFSQWQWVTIKEQAQAYPL